MARARIFISCGQRDGPEREAADRIGEVLDDLGFEYYIAVNEASLVGLKENVFRQLEQSEYILFVDFRREQLANLTTRRGSLFSHQELAVAAYLGIDWLPLQQEGVERNGIMSFTQSNVVPFHRPEELPELVAREIPARGWRNDWKNALSVELAAQYDDATDQNRRIGRYFHLTIRNLHHSKVALNVLGYLESLTDLTRGHQHDVRTVELRWAGYALPAAAILPNSSRDLDLGLVFHDQPNHLYFNSFSTSTLYMHPLVGPGQFRLVYVIISENFPPTRCAVDLHLGSQLTDVAIVPAPLS